MWCEFRCRVNLGFKVISFYFIFIFNTICSVLKTERWVVLWKLRRMRGFDAMEWGVVYYGNW